MGRWDTGGCLVAQNKVSGGTWMGSLVPRCPVAHGWGAWCPRVRCHPQEQVGTRRGRHGHVGSSIPSALVWNFHLAPVFHLLELEQEGRARTSPVLRAGAGTGLLSWAASHFRVRQAAPLGAVP